MLFSISMFPIGQGDSLADPVAEVVDDIDRAGFAYQVTSMDTQVEGEWDEVMPVIRKAQMRLLEEYPRGLPHDRCGRAQGSTVRPAP